jgi:PAS domain S-box-containing protein
MVGIISSFNVYKLEKSIDGLMTDNYKSIAAANNMNQSIQLQDKAILQYIQFQKKSAVDLFYKSNDEFYNCFDIEKNNITEVGEKEIVGKINVDYIDFIKIFSDLQEYQSSHNSSETIEFYNTTVTSKINKLEKDLKDLSILNEKAMFNGKNKVKINAKISLYIILIISGAAAIIGLIVSMIYTNKSLKPIYLLTETIKSVKEGELYKQAPIIYEDEIGMLSREFNDMTKRLHEFEQSTKGNLLTEKYKSVAIVKSISDPLIVLDENYKITLINHCCEDFFGIKEEDVCNKHFLESIRNGELYDYIFYVINKNAIDNEKEISINIKDKIYYFNTIVTAVKNKSGKINSVVVLLKNITEFKNLENIRTDFIATISHELKTPLTSIMMGTGLLLDKNIGVLNDKQKKLLDTIKEEIEKLTDLVGNLLKLSRIQSDRAIFDIKPSSISEIINNSMSNFYEQAKNCKVKLCNAIHEDLPKINVDGEKITWVLNNLMSNALKYTSAGDEITIGAYVEDKMMKVYVKDTGKGIPEEYIKKIFEKFVKSNRYVSELASTGLGLYIAKGIVEAHKGTIWCDSKMGEGSTFTFTLPIEEE